MVRIKKKKPPSRSAWSSIVGCEQISILPPMLLCMYVHVGSVMNPLAAVTIMYLGVYLGDLEFACRGLHDTSILLHSS